MSKYYLNTNILTHGGPVSHVSLLTPSTECCKWWWSGYSHASCL